MANRGRPRLEIDKEQLEKLMGFRPNTYDCAGFFKVSRETIIRFIKAEYDMTFIDFRKTYGAHVKLLLIQKAIEKAKSGDKDMLRYCINNLAGWTNGWTGRSLIEDEDRVDDIEWITE